MLSLEPLLVLPHYHADIINNAKATKKLQLCNEKRETKQWKWQFCPKGAKRGWEEGGRRRRDDEVMKKDARRYPQTGIALHCCCCFMFYLISRKLYYNDKCKASYVHRGSRWHFHLHDGRERVFKFERTILEYGVQSVRSSMCWFNLGSKQLSPGTLFLCTKRGLNSLASTSVPPTQRPVPVYSPSLSISLSLVGKGY